MTATSKHVLLWLLAFLITAASAVYQRLTGPTHPLRGSVAFQGQQIDFKFLRSQTVEIDVPVVVTVPDTAIGGYVEYRRYKSYDDWSRKPLLREGDKLQAVLPHQPAAGKLMYRVMLQKGAEQVALTGEAPLVLRYKGAVPLAVLLPHVLLMFLAMLYANRTALEALRRDGDYQRLMRWTIGLCLLGGFIFGPLVQKYAFGELWTGIPFGYDLTDNKTLIAMLGWLGAYFASRRNPAARWWVVAAGVLMLAVYLIPHSVLGSEIDYRK